MGDQKQTGMWTLRGNAQKQEAGSSVIFNPLDRRLLVDRSVDSGVLFSCVVPDQRLRKRKYDDGNASLGL